jgi:hypothetical protein
MSFKYLVISLLIGMPAGISNGQQVDPAVYFPLEIGNEWTYIEVLFPPFMPPDTLWDGPVVVAGMESINDTSYYSINGFPTLSRLYRTDGAGKIWGRMDGRDQLIFDFTLSEGQSYSFSTGPDSIHVFEVTLQRGLSMEVSAGRFDDVALIYYRPVQTVLDSGGAFYFAPGVGPIRWWYGMGFNGTLHRALIGGLTITDVEDRRDIWPRDVKLTPFPNPFHQEVSFSVSTRTSSFAEARVVDILGREVARFEPDYCSVERCFFTWNAVRMADGVYLILATSDSAVRQSVVVLRK